METETEIKPPNIWNSIAARALRTGAHIPIVEEEFDAEKAASGAYWNFQFNRRRKPAVIEAFAALMHEKTFAVGSTIRIARNNLGDWILVDGQHRLAAIAATGVKTWLMVVADERPANEAYSKIDNVGSLRTYSDALSSILGWNTKYYWTSTVGAARIIAAGFSKSGFFAGAKLRSSQQEETAKVMTEMREHIERLLAIAESTKQKEVTRSPALSVLLAAAKHNADVFYPWFERAVADDMLPKDSTEKRFVETFSWPAKENIDRYRLAMTTALIWNAQYGNKNMPSIPRVWLAGDRWTTKWPGILGTPFGAE